MEQRYISKKEKERKHISDQEWQLHNDQFIKQEKSRLKNYFQNMFMKVDTNIVLDQEQLDAIITDDDYEIIIAGAGSGKTTTMAAKVKYLTEILHINPKNIVIISYTNEAVNELKDRIQKGFQIPVQISTFHQLCLNIIGRSKNKIIDSNEKIIRNYFQKKRKRYHYYLKYHHIKLYIQYYFKNIVFPRDQDLCINFLNRFQTNGYENFDTLLFQYRKKKKVLSFLLLVQDIYDYYQDYLIKNHLIDFDGMINQCYDKLNQIHLDFQYLIIDEYQDISYIRFRLIQKIAKLYHTKIVVVGDDFQSIYAFSGSDLSLFINFDQKMGYAKKLKITNTYRNSQELIDIIGNFIMKNSNQIHKNLYSLKHLKSPIIFVPYSHDKIKKLEKCIDDIVTCYGKKKNILVLGRYKHDVQFIQNSSRFKVEQDKIIDSYFPDVSIRFLTAHASKGLGFDNVIIINNENSLYGFPSHVKDHPYLKIIQVSSERYPYAEERRLFYVAITRTKNKVYLLYPKKNPSIFIKELQKDILRM